MKLILISTLKLVILILGEYFKKVKRKREADEAYRADMAEFERLAAAALIKMRLQLSQDSQDAGAMDDAMDEAIRRSKANEFPKEG